MLLPQTQVCRSARGECSEGRTVQNAPAPSKRIGVISTHARGRLLHQLRNFSSTACLVLHTSLCKVTTRPGQSGGCSAPRWWDVYLKAGRGYFGR